MITIEGKVENTNGAPKSVKVLFFSLSTPLAEAGVLTGNSQNYAQTDPTDGTFDIDLKAGNYRVSYTTENRQTVFNITLDPADDGTTQQIDDVVSSPLEFVAVAPNELWNGTRAGHITFDPIADPVWPSALSEVAYVGGTIANGDSYSYLVTYETLEGETRYGSAAPHASSVTADTAIRVPLAVSPSRVTNKKIWRNISSGGTTYRLLAEISPATAYYDDWEDHATFSGRAPAGDPPEFNTTAGKIFSDSGVETLYFSTSGLKTLAEITFSEDAWFSPATGSLFTFKGFPNATGYSILVQGGQGTTQGGNANVWGGATGSGNGGWVSLLGGASSASGDGGDVTVVGGNAADGTGGDIVLSPGSGSVADGVVVIQNALRVTGLGEGTGKVLTSDADGNATWQVATGGGGGLVGTGDPEGSVSANPGTAYMNDADESFWYKKTGSGNTGWVELIA